MIQQPFKLTIRSSEDHIFFDILDPMESIEFIAFALGSIEAVFWGRTSYCLLSESDLFAK